MRKKIANDQKLNVTEDALKGRARVWFEARPNSFIRSSFLQEFYSLEARAEIKNSWTMRKFKHSDDSLTEYYTEQRRIANHISPPMDTYEINYHIINQLPPRVREVLSVIDYADVDRIAQALSRLYAAHKESSENKGNRHR